MNHRHQLITQALALLPSGRPICSAAYAAHSQQGPRPPVWRPVKLYQYQRRKQALNWLLGAVVRSLQGHMSVGSYLGALLPDMSADDYRATLQHVRAAYLQDLLNHTTEDYPTLQFEDGLPTKPTSPDLQNLPGCI